MKHRTALVTGASSGIGQATARAFRDEGYRVIGTSRDATSIPESSRLDGVQYRSLDLADRGSLDAFATDLDAIDVLINNAGESQSGPLEELPPAAIERLFAVNVLGPIRLTQLVLPGMRERRYGRVIMVGSMLASFPLAYRSSYVSTKAAIKGFSDAARFETSPFGVWISTVEPGSINTGIGQRRTKYLAEHSPYAADFDTVITALEENEKTGLTADRVAATILRAVAADAPKPLYAVGSNAGQVLLAKRFAPPSLVEKATARRHGLLR